jgi:hypothetical protein
MTDALLAYLALGLSAGLWMLALGLSRLASPTTPEGRDLRRTLRSGEFPPGVTALIVALAVLSACAEVALLWPWRLPRLLRGGW